MNCQFEPGSRPRRVQWKKNKLGCCLNVKEAKVQWKNKHKEETRVQNNEQARGA